MNWFELYIIFALSVGIWACIDLIPEVRSTLFESNKIDDVLYERPFLFFFVLLVIASLIAPLVIPGILFPTQRSKIIKSLVDKV